MLLKVAKLVNGRPGSPKVEALWLSGVLILMFVSRVPFALSALDHVPLRADEIPCALSTLDRYLGVPSVTLAWPASSMQLLCSPIVPIRYILDSGLGLGPDSFARFLAGELRNPWPTLFYCRLVAAFSVSISLCMLALRFIRLGAGAPLACMQTLAIGTTPLMFFQSITATGDGISFGLYTAAFALCAFGRKGFAWLMATGFLLGMAGAAKNTAIFAVPLVAGAAMEDADAKWKSLCWLFLGAFMGFILSCPYLWVDPIRLAKAIMGNMTRSGEPTGIVGSLLFCFDVLPFWVVPTGLAGGVSSIVRRRAWLGGGALLSTLLAILFAAKAGVVFDRYLLPLLLPCLALAFEEFNAFLAREQEKHNNGKAPLAAGAMVAAAAISLPLNMNGAIEIYSRNRMTSFKEAYELVSKLPPGSVAAIHKQVETAVASLADAESLEKVAADCEAVYTKGDIVVDEKRSCTADSTVTALKPALTAKEQALIARYKAMSTIEEPRGVRLIIFSEDKRYGMISESDAISLFKQGKVDFIAGELAIEGFERSESSDSWAKFHARDRSLLLLGPVNSARDQGPNSGKE